MEGEKKKKKKYWPSLGWEKERERERYVKQKETCRDWVDSKI